MGRYGREGGRRGERKRAKEERLEAEAVVAATKETEGRRREGRSDDEAVYGVRAWGLPLPLSCARLPCEVADPSARRQGAASKEAKSSALPLRVYRRFEQLRRGGVRLGKCLLWVRRLRGSGGEGTGGEGKEERRKESERGSEGASSKVARAGREE